MEEKSGIDQQEPAPASAPTPAEFKGTGDGSLFQTILAMSLWLGSIHLNCIIVLLSFVFLPFSKAIAYCSLLPPYIGAAFILYEIWIFCLIWSRVVVVLLIFAVIPIDEKSKWGRSLARFDFYYFAILSIQMHQFHCVCVCVQIFRFQCAVLLRIWPISGSYVSMLVATFQCTCMWRILKHSIPIKHTVSSPIKKGKQRSLFLILYYSGDQAITVFFLKFVMLLYSPFRDLFSVTLYVIVLWNCNFDTKNAESFPSALVILSAPFALPSAAPQIKNRKSFLYVWYEQWT